MLPSQALQSLVRCKACTCGFGRRACAVSLRSRVSVRMRMFFNEKHAANFGSTVELQIQTREPNTSGTREGFMCQSLVCQGIVERIAEHS